MVLLTRTKDDRERVKRKPGVEGESNISLSLAVFGGFCTSAI